MSPETAKRFATWFNSARFDSTGGPYFCDYLGTVFEGLPPNSTTVPRTKQIAFEEQFYAYQESKGFQTSLDSEPETSILNLMDVVLKACAANKSTAKLCLKKFTQWLDSTKF